MTHKLEQENQELKCQLQDAQRQNDVLNKRLFNFENCKCQRIQMLLFYGLSKLGHFNGCF